VLNTGFSLLGDKRVEGKAGGRQGGSTGARHSGGGFWRIRLAFAEDLVKVPLLRSAGDASQSV
jgi:hypothetical protein